MNWRRREPGTPAPLLQTMLLPNGQFVLLISELGGSVDRENIRESASCLPELIGAAAVILLDGPAIALNADNVTAVPVMVEDRAPEGVFAP